MKKIIVVVFYLIGFSQLTNAQVKIGDNVRVIDGSSLLEVEGIGKVIVLPRMLSTQVPVKPLYGAVVYATDLKCIYFYDSVSWRCLSNTSQGVNTSFTVSSNSLVITDNGGSLSVPLTSIIDTASLNQRINANKQAIIDSSSALRTTINNHILADKDTDSLNESNQTVILSGTNLTITDNKGPLTVNLSSLTTDTTSLSNRINTNKQAIIDSSTQLRTTINNHITADKDIDSLNETNKTLSLTGTDLTITDNKGPLTVSLATLTTDTTSLSNRIKTNKQAIIDSSSQLRTTINNHIKDDKDIDSLNESNQSLTLTGTDLSITDNKGTLRVNLSTLTTDTTSLSNRINTNKQAIIDSSTQLRTTINNHISADKDIDSLNEANKSLTLTGTNLTITDNKGPLSVSLATLTTDTTSLSNRINTNKQAIIDSSKSLRNTIDNHILADEDIDSLNEANQTLTLTGTDLSISDNKGSLTVSLATLTTDTTSLSNRINTNKQAIIDSSTQLRTTINNHITADKDLDSLNEANKTLSLTGTDLTITDNKGPLTVSLATLTTDTTSLSNRINTNKQAIIDSSAQLRTTINNHITADKDIDTTNEKIKSFAIVGDSLEIIENNSSYKVALSKLDATLANNGLTKTGDTVQLGGTLIKPTAVGTSATNTIAFTGLQDGAHADSLMVVSNGGVVKKVKFTPNVVTTSANYTVLPDDDVIIFNGTAPSTITIPSASSSKDRVLKILNYANSTSNVNITLSQPVIYEGNDTEVILNSRSSMSIFSPDKVFGMTSNTLSTVTIVSNGTSWYKLGN